MAKINHNAQCGCLTCITTPETWRKGESDPNQVEIDNFADTEIAQAECGHYCRVGGVGCEVCSEIISGYNNPDCLDSNEDFEGDVL
ncbi:MAG: hypothetical protein ACREBR_05010 [bacterium]